MNSDFDILPASPTNRPGQPAARWQQIFKQAVRDPAELCEILELAPQWVPAARRAAELFPLRVPRGFVARMRKGDPHDPLLRQVLPLEAECERHAGFSADPVGDRAAEQASGLLQKYQGRALLVTTGACAVHCRYCFRRHFPYHESPHGLAEWKPALEAIAADPSLSEILLSGGDPLSLVDPWLAELAEQLANIPHVKRLRIHTRLPIVIPERVSDALLEWLVGSRLRGVVVLHANHPQEIDRQVAQAIRRLVESGLMVLNQAVLLRGVNDNLAALKDLCESLVDLGVQPYYLHQLDRVAGAAHFEVPEPIGKRLVQQLRRLLPGYAVPRYVKEVPLAESKLPLV